MQNMHAIEQQKFITKHAMLCIHLHKSVQT